MNIVTEPEGNGAAVLIRAVEPLANIDGNTKGPGLLCRALGIDRGLNGHDLLSDDFHVAAPVTFCSASPWSRASSRRFADASFARCIPDELFPRVDSL